MARNVVVREGSLQFGSVTFYRGHAEDVELGSIGEKRTPITKVNHLDVKEQIPMGNVRTAQVTVADIDFERTTKGAFKRSVRVSKGEQSASMSANATFDGLRSGTLKLVKFSIRNDDVMRAANSSPTVLRRLLHFNKRARIAHQIFVVMQASTVRQFGFDLKGTARLQVTVEGVEVEAAQDDSVAGRSRTRVTLSPGTTFAYLLLKIEWDAKLKKKRKRIVDLDQDQFGLG